MPEVMKVAEEEAAAYVRRWAEFTAHLERGNAYSQAGNFEYCIRELKEALKLAPNVERAVHTWKMIEVAKKTAYAKEQQEWAEEKRRQMLADIEKMDPDGTTRAWLRSQGL
jgi:tetratricopeptide (TPR) repeat protein